MATTTAIHVLDGQLLDLEVENSLFSGVNDSLLDMNLPPIVQRIKANYQPEIKLFIRVLLFKLLIWDKSTTYGFILQNLKLKLNKFNKLGLLLAVILIYLNRKFESYIYGSGDDDNSNFRSVYLEQVKPRVEKYKPLMKLLVTLRFLLNGKQTNFTHSILGIRYEKLQNFTNGVSISNPESISYEFQNRQLIWNGVTELLKVAKIWDLPILRKNSKRSIDKTAMSQLNMGKCPICFEGACNPIEIKPCGDIYCYVCFMKHVSDEDNGGDVCVKCEYTINGFSFM